MRFAERKPDAAERLAHWLARMLLSKRFNIALTSFAASILFFRGGDFVDGLTLAMIVVFTATLWHSQGKRDGLDIALRKVERINKEFGGGDG